MARYEAKFDLSKEFEKSFSLPLFTGDSGSSVSLEFYQNGVPYDMSGAMLYARRADGVILASSGVAQGNKAELVLTNSMYLCPGELQVQISVVDVYGNFLTNGVLYFTVREGFSEQVQGEGSDNYCDLTALIQKVGEGLGSIQRAETAAASIEALMKKIPNLENQIIEHITEAETDYFTYGFAVVTAIESEDSEGGPIFTEYHYPLLAESEDLFGNVTIRQTRFFKGNLEQRTVGGEWTSLSDQLSVFVTKDDLNKKLSSIYKVKGSKQNFTDLPTSGNTIGDVWNIENEYMLSKMVYPITVIGTDDSYLNEVGWLLLNCNNETFPAEVQESSVTIYDSTGKKIGSGYIPYGGSSVIQASVTTLESGNYYVEFSPDLAEYHTTKLELKEIRSGDNVVWTENGWDVLAGTVDLSDYVTKEELGNIETALAQIEALQNSYINGEEA